MRLTKGREAKAQVFEVFGRPPTDREPQWAPETVLRCEVERDIWDVVSPEARAEFNRRLKAEGKPSGRWGADETAVQRLFGKELLVLLWAVEPARRDGRGDRGRDPQLAWAQARGALVALYDDGGDDGARASSRHGLARRAAAGPVLRHALRRLQLERRRRPGTLAPRANAKFAPSKQRKPQAKTDDDPGLLFTPSAAE